MSILKLKQRKKDMEKHKLLDDGSFFLFNGESFICRLNLNQYLCYQYTEL